MELLFKLRNRIFFKVLTFITLNPNRSLLYEIWSYATNLHEFVYIFHLVKCNPNKNIIILLISDILSGKVINVLEKIGNQEAVASLTQIIGDDSTPRTGTNYDV